MAVPTQSTHFDPDGGGGGGDGPALSNAAPAALAPAAAAGDSLAASRGNHVHPFPSAEDVDAVSLQAVGLLPGERNRGNWDAAVAYEIGDVVHDHQEPIALWKAIAASTNAVPHLSPASWEQINADDRHIAIGVGAAADGDAAAAFGPAADATGNYSTALGPLAHAEGTSSVAIGPLTRAEDDGEVNIANLIVGSLDPLTYEPGDLWLAAGAYTAGEVTGGVLRRVTALNTIWTTAPAVTPTDVAVGTAHRVKWDATITQPDIQTHSFGPRGVWSLEGIHELSADQTATAFEPVGWLDFMTIGNTPGQNRTQVPAWGYIGGRWRFADDGTVTYAANDTNSGGAEFVDTPVWLTRNTGTIDGVTNDAAYASFYSAGVAGGNTSLFRKIGFAVKDMELTEPVGFDAANVSIAQQLGLFVPHMTFGDENIGVWNGSATVEAPQAVEVGSSTTIPRGATTYHLTSTALAINTATPIIPDGVDGERVTLHNVGAYAIGLAGEAAAAGLPATAGSNLAQWVYLIPGASVTLQWTGSVWAQTAVNSPNMLVSDGQLLFQAVGDTHQRLAIGAGPGGGGLVEWGSGSGAVDVRISRTAAGLLGFTLGRFDTLPANRMTLNGYHAPAAPAAQSAIIYCRDSGGKTQLAVRFPTGAVQVLATEP